MSGLKTSNSVSSTLNLDSAHSSANNNSCLFQKLYWDTFTLQYYSTTVITLRCHALSTKGTQANEFLFNICLY